MFKNLLNTICIILKVLIVIQHHDLGLIPNFFSETFKLGCKIHCMQILNHNVLLMFNTLLQCFDKISLQIENLVMCGFLNLNRITMCVTLIENSCEFCKIETIKFH